MDTIVEEQGELRRRKKIKFRHSASRSRVRLQAPGFNLPTVGAATLLLCHALVVMTGGVNLNAGLYEHLAVSSELLQRGQVWGLFTHSFLHGNWVHVILNALLFYYACARVSHIFSTGKVILIFVVSAAVAAAGHSLMQWLVPGLPQYPLVGASGGLMGLFLAQTELFPDSRMLLLPVSGRNMGRGILVASALLFILTPGLGLPVFAQLGSLIDQLFAGGLFLLGHLYHFIGGVVGILMVQRLLPPMINLEQLKKERALKEESAL